MPSRKKIKGKARKAAKAAKAKEVAANQLHEGSSLEVQLQRLTINDTSPTKCVHGRPQLSPGDMKIHVEFINAFMDGCKSREDVGGAFTAATVATEEKYADMYSSKMKTVISMLLFVGTQSVLEGRNDIARWYAMLASFFEELIAVEVRKSKAIVSWTKVFELSGADDHTLVSYYRKRISCSCLDEKYKEVKSVKKLGLCCNVNCSLPERKVERSKMLYCTQCGEANYCSVECQKDHWKIHRKICDRAAEAKAGFNSE